VIEDGEVVEVIEGLHRHLDDLDDLDDLSHSFAMRPLAISIVKEFTSLPP